MAPPGTQCSHPSNSHIVGRRWRSGLSFPFFAKSLAHFGACFCRREFSLITEPVGDGPQRCFYLSKVNEGACPRTLPHQCCPSQRPDTLSTKSIRAAWQRTNGEKQIRKRWAFVEAGLSEKDSRPFVCLTPLSSLFWEIFYQNLSHLSRSRLISLYSKMVLRSPDFESVCLRTGAIDYWIEVAQKF
jgi:hypothetical protein